jgi:hypothetical protein
MTPTLLRFRTASCSADRKSQQRQEKGVANVVAARVDPGRRIEDSEA